MNNSSDKAFDLIGLGMSVVDIIQLVPDFPKSGGVTEAPEIKLLGGGPVPTALCTASRLGARVAVIDRIGSDWQGELIRQEYQQYGVQTENLMLEPERTSTVANVLVRESDGERHIIFSKGNFTPLTESELPKDVLQSCRVLHLNGRHWPACLAAADIAKASGVMISFDGGAGRYEPKFDALLEKTDILIVARDFAEKYTQSEQLEDQLGALVKTGASILAITDGAEGSWFATSTGEVFHQPAYPVKSLVDTTGCGDAFHGGFLYAYTLGWSIRESAAFASAVAATNATGLGGRGHLPTLSEVRELLLNRA